MCGGKSQQQKAADSTSKLSDVLATNAETTLPLTNQFWTNQMDQGLGPDFMKLSGDYTGGSTAQAYAPARAQLAQRLSRMGNTGLPSGFATQANTDLDTNQSRTFDNQILQNFLLNKQAKMQGAGALNPLGTSQTALGGYGGIMNMPQKPSLGGSILGGALGGLGGGI